MSLQVSNPLDWWYDEMFKQWLTLYYWPYFVIGNIDDWIGMGITLNGMRPVCRG